MKVNRIKKNQFYDNVNPNDLRNKTLKGLSWGTIDKGANIIIQFLVGVLLARLLLPEDFGLLGLALIVIGFSDILVNLGLGPALIQRQQLTIRHVRVCFTISGLAGILLAVTIYFTSPFIAYFFATDNVIPILKALSIIFILKGLEVPSAALLNKKLDFKSLFIINVTKTLFYGGLAVVLALSGYGIWSLVIGNVAVSFLSLILNYLFIKHSVVPLISKIELKELSHFGVGMTINNIFNYFALKGDYFFVGRILGTSALGLYTRAYSLMQMPTTQFVSILSSVLFPATSIIQNDLEKTRRFFIKSIKIISFLVAPVCMMMVALAPELIIGVYGNKWSGAIVPLQILCFVGFFRATYNIGGAFLRAKGLVYKLFLGNLVYGLSMIIGVWIGATYNGIVGASVAVCFSIFLIWLIIMWYNCKMLQLKLRDIVKFHLPGIFVGIVAMGIIILIKKILLAFLSNTLLVMLICVPVIFIALLFSIYILPRQWMMGIKEEMQSLLNHIRLPRKLKRIVLFVFK